ncbi:MAG: hypothetical protein H6587_00540 [Flavobacteriales bacterium]|nr:hypothetical protein [Flavobacteriales bacterium]
MKHIKNFSEFINDIEKSKKEGEQITIDDIKKIIDDNGLTNATINHPLDNDVWIYRLTIIALTVIILTISCVTTYIMCICGNNCEMPSGLIAIGATATGALASLISLSNRK